MSQSDFISFLRHRGKRCLLRLGFSKLPVFIICGAQKAGTTFLYSVLRQHPQIVEPVNKEAHFFDDDAKYKKGIFQYYLNFDLSFRFKEDQLTFEATPDYLSTKLAPQRIKSCLPNVKLIVILREPISRAYSGWKMHHFLFKNHPRHGDLFDPRSFEQVVDDAVNKCDIWDIMNHPGKGLYGMQLKNLFQFFDREKVLILFQSDLKGDTQTTLNKVFDFLDIRRLDLDEIDEGDERFWNNKSATEDHALSTLKNETIERLQEYYKEDKMTLQKQLGIHIPW